VLTLLKRDLKLAYRSINALFAVFAFYFIASFIFLFAFSQNAELIKHTFAAIILINAIMAAILTIPDLIRRDYETKILEQIYLQSVPMGKIVFSKLIAHWITTGLPLAVFAAFTSTLSGALDTKLTLAILLASPVISIIAVMTSCITLGIRNGGVMAAIISIPLYIPLIIFTLTNLESGANPANILGLFLVLLPLCIFVGGYSLKLALED
jgi:heme exporter protein B